MINPSEKNWEDRLCEMTISEWEKGKQYNSDLDFMYDDIYAMIRGDRPDKEYDWQSNVTLNKVFQVVWTAIPYITQKIFGGTPIIGLKSYDKYGAWQREEILQWYHTLQPGSPNHNPYFLTVVAWVLRGLLNGVSVMKKTWHQKVKSKMEEKTLNIPVGVQEDGSMKFLPHTQKTRTTYPVEDWPFNVIINNKDLVVDWLLQPGQSIVQGRFIIHRDVVDLDFLYSSKINYMNLDKIDRKETIQGSKMEEDHSANKQYDGQENFVDSDIYKEVEVFERQGLVPVYKEKKNGKWIPSFDKEDIYSDKVIFKHMIITVAHGKENVLIRFDSNDYGEFNYVDLHIYLDAERWQSVGMVEPFKDLVSALNDNINASFDEINQNLMPPVIVNKYALWDWDTMQYAPQQRWLVGGNPADAVYFKEPSNITKDAWQRHILFDNEIQLTSSITPAMSGMGKEKAATTNVLNQQMSAGKLDFIIKMIETTGLIPSAQMDIRFAKKFAHPLTFETILGAPFQFSDWEEIYRYIPAASSVKLEYQREQEVMQDTELIRVLSSVPSNPNIPKILNQLLANIFRNKDMTEAAKMLLDE